MNTLKMLDGAIVRGSLNVGNGMRRRGMVRAGESEDSLYFVHPTKQVCVIAWDAGNEEYELDVITDSRTVHEMRTEIE